MELLVVVVCRVRYSYLYLRMYVVGVRSTCTYVVVHMLCTVCRYSTSS